MLEDSLEVDPHGANMTGNLWCTDYLEEFESRRGYDVSKYLPVLILWLKQFFKYTFAHVLFFFFYILSEH